jgi:hypothetical protein
MLAPGIGGRPKDAYQGGDSRYDLADAAIRRIAVNGN